MISVSRGKEPDELVKIRSEQLALLRGLGRSPTSNDISAKYRDVAEFLWERQHYKCCYCEHRISMSFNDVEHYRPKSSAKRLPGCDKTHGYWWLAFSWENLLYACPSCNRSSKKDRFPLAKQSISLVAESGPPGAEIPLLLDPAGSIIPIEHIEFVQAPRSTGKKDYWWAVPRKGSELGLYTIDVCNLNRDELLELRNVHYKTVIAPQIAALEREISRSIIKEVDYQYSRALEMMKPDNEFAALAYYAFRSSILDSTLHSIIGEVWPEFL